MAIVKTGIGRSKRDLLKKLSRLKKFVDTRKGEFTTKDKVVFKKAIVNMSLAYKLLDKIDCVQDEMSIPFGHYEGAARASRKGRRGR
jgi:hypothetical protein